MGKQNHQNSVDFAKQHKAKLVLVDDGHRLSDSGEELNKELVQIIKNKENNDEYNNEI